MFKAFRTIPVIGQIIDDIPELCPDAWLVNFTNPSGMVTEAAIKHFSLKKTIGLRNVPVGSMCIELKMIGCESDELTFKFAGLNHFHWHRVFDARGKVKAMEECAINAAISGGLRSVRGCVPGLAGRAVSAGGISPLAVSVVRGETTVKGIALPEWGGGTS